MMFERYTDRSRRCVVLAQEEARMLNHAEVDVEHLLLGLAAEDDGVAHRALEALGVTVGSLRDAVTAVRPIGDHPVPGHLVFTAPLKKVLELGLREALKLGHNYVGTEHLLLGLAHDCETRESACAGLLETAGTEPAKIRMKVLELLRGYEENREPVARTIEEAGKRLERLEDQVTLTRVVERLDTLNRRLEAIGAHLGVEFPCP